VLAVAGNAGGTGQYRLGGCFGVPAYPVFPVFIRVTRFTLGRLQRGSVGKILDIGIKMAFNAIELCMHRMPVGRFVDKKGFTRMGFGYETSIGMAFETNLGILYLTGWNTCGERREQDNGCKGCQPSEARRVSGFSGKITCD
jgi:hypothetical protein